jgi:7,8-dihydroneopterin aldolase/epimerase/oxygenase
MGIIKIEDMEFYAFHGHYREEQIVGNRFLVDVSIDTDTSQAGESDNLKDAVNYQVVYSIVKREMETKSHLLEHVAKRIIDAIYKETTGINRVTVRVSKMNPVMGGRIGRVSVEMAK